MSPLNESQQSLFCCVAELDAAAQGRFRDIVLKALTDRLAERVRARLPDLPAA